MRKGTIKAAVLAAVFIGAVLIFGRFMNDTNEDLTTEMKEATLPVITMYQGDQELNELHGYVTEMDAAYMRDTITRMRMSLPMRSAAGRSRQICRSRICWKRAKSI